MLEQKYEFRYVKQEEGYEAAMVEQKCFPPNEACTVERMLERVKVAPETFMVVVDKENGNIAAIMNGIATDEEVFRDEYFTDARLHNPNGKNIMILGIAVLPEYQMQGIARMMVQKYCEQEKAKGRANILLTCLDSKVTMYEKFGFIDKGMANSVWGGEEWHEMIRHLLPWQ